MPCVTEIPAEHMDLNAGCVVGILQIFNQSVLYEDIKRFRKRAVCHYINRSARYAVIDGAET